MNLYSVSVGIYMCICYLCYTVVLCVYQGIYQYCVSVGLGT